MLHRPGSNYTITFRSGSVTLTSLQSEEALALTGGTLTLNRASAVNNNFTLNGGTLDGGGDLTIAGQFTWLAGTLRGNGRTLSNGGMLIDGGSGKALHGRTLNNAAFAIWRGTSGISGADGGTVNNLAGATLDSQSDASLSYGCCLGAIPTLNNAGTLRKSAGSGTTAFTSVTFNNTGVVQIQSGTLEHNGNSVGTSTGNFHSEAGTALNFRRALSP